MSRLVTGGSGFPTGASDFSSIELEARLTRDGELDHRQAVIGEPGRLPRLVGRIPRRQKANFRDREPFEGQPGDFDVSRVDGVKNPPEERESRRIQGPFLIGRPLLSAVLPDRSILGGALVFHPDPLVPVPAFPNTVSNPRYRVNSGSTIGNHAG